MTLIEKVKDNTVPLALFVVAIGVYSGTFSADFVFDDAFHIVRSRSIKQLKPFWEYFLHPSWPGDLYRPLVVWSFALTYYFSALDPWIYHLTNILLHGFVTLSLYWVFANSFGERLGALSALLFAIHPVHVETVANISYRPELMASLFGLLATGFAIKVDSPARREYWQYLICFVCFLAALFSKESAFCFFLLIPLLIWSRFGFQDGFAKLWKSLVAIGSAGGIYLVLRTIALGGFSTVSALGFQTTYIDNPLVDFPHYQRIFYALILLGKYFVFSLFPLELSADYSFQKIAPGSEEFLLEAIPYGAIFAVLLFYIVYGIRFQPKLAFAGMWFLGAMFVTSNILFPIGTIFAERLVYLASAGSCFLLSVCICALKRKELQIFLAVVLCVLYSVKTYRHSLYWANNETLFSYELNISSRSAKVHNNYASLLFDRGLLEQSELHFRRALQIYPSYPNAARGVAKIYLKKNIVSGAIHWLAKALKYNPNHIPSMLLLGRLELSRGNLEMAERKFKAVLQLRASNFWGKLGLLEVALAKNSLGVADRLLSELIELDPANKQLEAFSKKLEERRNEL